MITYFDTSSLVPALIAEDAAAQCAAMWEAADQRVTSRVTFVEATAAIARAERSSGINADIAQQARRTLDAMWARMHVIEFSENLMHSAAGCATRFGLRGYDAVHCASAMLVSGIDMVAVSGDQELLAVWLDAGMAVADTSSR